MTSIELRNDFTMPNIRLSFINMEWVLNPVCNIHIHTTSECYTKDILEFSKKSNITLEIVNKQETKNKVLKSMNFTSKIYIYSDYQYYHLEYSIFDREYYNLNIKDIEININITFNDVNLANLLNSIYFTEFYI